MARTSADGTRSVPATLRRPRRGFSFVEFLVAMLLFGITISGLFPLVVMYSRTVQSLEKRPNTLAHRAGGWVHQSYLVPLADRVTPSSDAWAHKLGAGALVTCVDPGAKVTPPAPTPEGLVADDGDPGYTDTGGDWATDSGVGYPSAQPDRHRHAHAIAPAPTADEYATWTFTNVPPGWYQVEASWIAASDQTSDAWYTVYGGDPSPALPISVPAKNQQNPPMLADNGTLWEPLGSPVYFASGTASVRLSGVVTPTTAYVVADAVRLVLIENNVQVESLQRSAPNESETATVHVKITTP